MSDTQPSLGRLLCMTILDETESKGQHAVTCSLSEYSDLESVGSGGPEFLSVEGSQGHKRVRNFTS